MKCIESQEFAGLQQGALEKAEYYECSFTNCDFSESNLSQLLFCECQFTDCNLSLSKLPETSFQDVSFLRCKFSGTDFSGIKDLLVEFEFFECMLKYAIFESVNIQGTRFDHCDLGEADFSGTNLQRAMFSKCELNRAVFENSNLNQASFTGSINVSIDPERNQIRGAKFDLTQLPGLLQKHQILVD